MIISAAGGMKSDADGCMSATSVLSELPCFASALFFRLDYFLATVHCEKYTICYGILLKSPVRNECKETLALVILSTLLKLIM